jgi:hypothetical protein
VAARAAQGIPNVGRKAVARSQKNGPAPERGGSVRTVLKLDVSRDTKCHALSGRRLLHRLRALRASACVLECHEQKHDDGNDTRGPNPRRQRCLRDGEREIEIVRRSQAPRI